MSQLRLAQRIRVIVDLLFVEAYLVVSLLLEDSFGGVLTVFKSLNNLKNVLILN